MSNFNIKAKNKLTGRIYDFTAIDHVYDYSYIQEDLNVTLTSNDFNQLFEVIPQTDLGVNDDTSKKDDILEDPNHPYVGGEVEDKETWRDRFYDNDLDRLDFCGDENHDCNCTVKVDEILDFFQQELERIKTNFMKEFTDPDTNLINISKYDHEELINFFNKEIK